MYLDRLLSRVHHYHLFAEDGLANAGAGAAAGGEQGGAAAAVDKTLLGSGDGSGADDGAGGTADPPPPETDWRDGLAGGDEVFLRHLKRYSSPENFGKAHRELQKRVSTGQVLAPLPENATADELAAYRKAVGIPEKADAYDVAFPEAIKPSEQDTETLAAFKEHMHAANVPPSAAKAAFDFYVKRMGEGQAAREAAVHEATVNGLAELRSEYKHDFRRNVTLADEFLAKHGGDKAPDLMHIRLADGRELGNHPDFVRLIVAAARATADDEALIGGDGNGGGKSMDEEYQDLVKKSVTPGQKLSDSESNRMMQLAGARLTRDERASRSRAA